MGQLLRGLREQRIDDDTLVIVFGDHGEAFGEHEGNFAHTLFIHEENVRVPYVIAAPGAIAEPIRVGRVASVIERRRRFSIFSGCPPPRIRAIAAPSRTADGAFLYRLLAWLVGLTDGCWKYLYRSIPAGRTC